MFTINSNGIITVNRGDTFTTTLFINAGQQHENDEQYILQEKDRVYFALCEPNQPFEQAIVKKVFSREDLDEDNNVVIKFKSEDTEYLMPGTYYYMIKLNKVYDDESKNEIDTIVPKTKFFIL